jgi:hypothetical protein
MLLGSEGLVSTVVALLAVTGTRGASGRALHLFSAGRGREQFCVTGSGCERRCAHRSRMGVAYGGPGRFFEVLARPSVQYCCASKRPALVHSGGVSGRVHW